MSILTNSAVSVNHTGFIPLQEVDPNSVIYGMVSTDKQKLWPQVDRLHFQVCSYAGLFDGFLADPQCRIRIFQEVHTGTTFDRPEFQKCIALARREGLTICVHDISRLVRHPEYCPYHGRKPRPLPEQIEYLCGLGVTFALLEFTEDDAMIRSAETRRGLRHGRKGGRPKAPEADARKVQEWRALRMSYRDIAKLTGLSKSTVERLSQNCPINV